MDLPTIVELSAALAGTCKNVSGQIGRIIDQVKQDDTTLGELRLQIDALSQIFHAISATFRKTAAREKFGPTTTMEAHHWVNVTESMRDCIRSLETVGKTLEGLGNIKRTKSLSNLRKSLKKIERSLDSGNIELLKHQITAYRRTMEISLQLLMLSAAVGGLGDRVVNSELSYRLDSLMLDMHQLFWIFPDQSVEDLAVMANLEKCVRSARHVLSQTSNPNMQRQEALMAQQRMQSPNASAGPPRAKSPPVNNLPSPAITPSPNHTATPSPNTSVERFDDTRAPTSPPTSALPLPSPTTPLPLYFRSEPEPVLVPEEASIPPSNSSISNKTHVQAIRQWFDSAKANFALGDYTKAEPILVWVLNESDGRDFDWVEETITMLVEVYFRLQKWTQVNELLNQKFDGRDVVLEKVGNKLCQERRWNDCERLLRYDFEGKENVMIRVARSYIGNQKWDDAKKHLVELMKFQSESTTAGLERMYILADVCWTKKDLDDARYWCLRAVQGKQTLLDKSHALFYQFISLLVRICQAQGNNIEANAFKALLASSSTECAEIEELCQMRPKDAVNRFKDCFKDIPLTKKQRKIVSDSLGKKHGLIGAARGGGWSLLHAFATHGKSMAVQLMLEKGANIAALDEDGNDPINCAAANGHASIVQMLWDKGADPRVKNKLGYPTLLSAALKGHDKVISVLLERGADIETTDNDGNTILMSAVMDGFTNIVELVLDKGADIEAKNKMGRTALMLGTLLGDIKMTELLIKRGANLEARDTEGNTALILAGGKEHVEVIELLLTKGADLNARNHRGHDALTLAKRTGVYRTQAVLTLSIAKAHDKVVSPPTSPPPYSRSRAGSQASREGSSVARRSPSILSRVTQRTR